MSYRTLPWGSSVFVTGYSYGHQSGYRQAFWYWHNRSRGINMAAGDIERLVTGV